MAPAGLGHGDVVNPVLSWPVIGDWVFRVLGAEVVTRQMVAAYAGRQISQLCWIGWQNNRRIAALLWEC